MISPPVCVKEAPSAPIAAHSCAPSPRCCRLATPKSISQITFHKSSWALFSAARPLRCHRVILKVRAVSFALNCVGLDQTKSHRYPAAPVQLAPQGQLIGRAFGPNGSRSELNLPALGPLQVSDSSDPGCRYCPELGHNREAIV